MQVNTESKIICGDILDVLPKLPRAQMIFADPPDNIGLKYANGDRDNKPLAIYLSWLEDCLFECAASSSVCWFSVNATHELEAGHIIRNWQAACESLVRVRKILWYFTFGQHRETDCGNNFRPIFRVDNIGYDWHTDRIRIPSERQRLGDKRANPNGRIPGDVWGGPADVSGLCRIQGNNKERRAWHPTQHPEKLVERCILMSTNEGDLVIDPFGGTFTTLRVCKRLNRRCISIDISEEYCRRGAEENDVLLINGPSYTSTETKGGLFNA